MKYRFLIYISHTYALPIGAPLQKEIQKQGYEVKWFSELAPPKDFFPEYGILINDVEGLLDYEPHIVLTVNNEVPHFIPGIKVQIFHGFLANKRTPERGHFRIRGFFDLYCTQGPSTTIPFKKLAKEHKHFEVIETGWSKMDSLFPIKENFSEKPVILISSTFSPKYSFVYIEEALKEIERLSAIGKWRFMVILHPKMAIEKIEAIKKMQHENLTYYDTTDIVPLFKKADIMFSDTTSAITEFILQKKPVVTFRNNKPGNYFINISEVSEIEQALALALTKPTDVMLAIQKYIDETHPYSDGKSSERVINSCINFLNSDRSYLRRKPLNLIRKFTIRKRLQYFKF